MDGLYELDGLAPGLHDLTVEGRGPRGESLRHQMTVEVEDGQFAKGDLDFASVLLVGTVASGTGTVVGARVRMWARLGFFDDMEDTDAAGRFRLRLPRPGSYHLRIDTPGGSAHDFDLTIPEGESEVRREFKVP